MSVSNIICYTNYISITSYLYISYITQTGGSRRKTVVEEKRLVVAASEEKFQAQVFKMTTDEDMPSYNAFDFAP